MRRLAFPAALLGVVVASACSVLTSYDGLTGAADGGGDGTLGGDAPRGDAGDSGPGDAPRDAVSEAGDAARGDAPGDAPRDVTFDVPSTCAAAGVACTYAAPPGWTGPVALYSGSGGAPVPACPAAFPMVAASAFASLSAPPASCSACACIPPPAPSCPNPPNVDFYQDPGCSVPCDTLSVPPGQCVPYSAACGVAPQGVDMTVNPPVNAGSCLINGGDATLQSITWGTAARACTAAGYGQSDCPAGQVCAPVPAPPFGAKLCILQQGSVGCPSGAYSQQNVFYEGETDSRGCAPCSCGGLSGETCGTLVIYSDIFGCSAPAFGPAPAPLTCNPFGAPSTQLGVVYSPGATQGSCPPGGGGPTGSASPASPVTVCCQP